MRGHVDESKDERGGQTPAGRPGAFHIGGSGTPTSPLLDESGVRTPLLGAAHRGGEEASSKPSASGSGSSNEQHHGSDRQIGMCAVNIPRGAQGQFSAEDNLDEGGMRDRAVHRRSYSGSLGHCSPHGPSEFKESLPAMGVEEIGPAAPPAIRRSSISDQESDESNSLRQPGGSSSQVAAVPHSTFQTSPKNITEDEEAYDVEIIPFVYFLGSAIDLFYAFVQKNAMTDGLDLISGGNYSLFPGLFGLEGEGAAWALTIVSCCLLRFGIIPVNFVWGNGGLQTLVDMVFKCGNPKVAKTKSTRDLLAVPEVQQNVIRNHGTAHSLSELFRALTLGAVFLTILSAVALGLRSLSDAKFNASTLSSEKTETWKYVNASISGLAGFLMNLYAVVRNFRRYRDAKIAWASECGKSNYQTRSSDEQEGNLNYVIGLKEFDKKTYLNRERSRAKWWCGGWTCKDLRREELIELGRVYLLKIEAQANALAEMQVLQDFLAPLKALDDEQRRSATRKLARLSKHITAVTELNPDKLSFQAEVSTLIAGLLEILNKSASSLGDIKRSVCDLNTRLTTTGKYHSHAQVEQLKAKVLQDCYVVEGLKSFDQLSRRGKVELAWSWVIGDISSFSAKQKALFYFATASSAIAYCFINIATCNQILKLIHNDAGWYTFAFFSALFTFAGTAANAILFLRNNRKNIAAYQTRYAKIGDKLWVGYKIFAAFFKIEESQKGFGFFPKCLVPEESGPISTKTQLWMMFYLFRRLFLAVLPNAIPLAMATYQHCGDLPFSLPSAIVWILSAGILLNRMVLTMDAVNNKLLPDNVKKSLKRGSFFGCWGNRCCARGNYDAVSEGDRNAASMQMQF